MTRTSIPVALILALTAGSAASARQPEPPPPPKPPKAVRVAAQSYRGDSPVLSLPTWTDIRGLAKADYREAKNSALEAAAERLRDDLGLLDTPPLNLVEKMIRGKTEEKIPFDSDPHGIITELTKVGLTIELGPDSRRELLDWERGERIRSRMLWLGRVMSVVVVGLAVAAGALRLDYVSRGYLSHLLTVVVIVTVVAAAVGVWWWTA